MIASNLLQARTIASSKRRSREICERLKCLDSDELDLLSEGDHQEQAYLLWLAICRHYKFISEFSVEVVRERFLTLMYDLSYEDFDAFFNEKMEWHEELEKITESTRKKLRQVLFRIMRESELLNSDNHIIPAMLSPRLINVICRHSNRDLNFYPIMDAGLRGCAK